jgi:hypothetical protein
LGATLLIACALVVIVSYETDEASVVMESNNVLKGEKAQATARIEALNKLKAIIHKAMSDPSPENVKAAMEAQQKLAGGALPPVKEAAPKAATPEAMPATETETKEESVQQDQAHKSTHSLEKQESTGLDRISRLKQMKAIVRKAEANPTPENIQAAMDAQNELASHPPRATHGVAHSADVADMIKAKMAQEPSQQAKVQTEAAPKATPKEAAAPKANDALQSKKASDQSDLDQLAELKVVIQKAMQDPSDANIQAAMDAKAKLEDLSGHKQAQPTPVAATEGPAVTEATSSAPLEESNNNKKGVNVEGFTKVKVATGIHGQHALKNTEKAGVTRINQLEKLKQIVKKAMKNPTPENVQAAMEAEKEMKEGRKNAPEAGSVEAPKPEPAEAVETSKPKPASKKVEFNLEIDSLGKIEVHKGDEAATLAQAFAKEHKLSDDMAKKLEDMIQGQMAAHNM